LVISAVLRVSREPWEVFIPVFLSSSTLLRMDLVFMGYLLSIFYGQWLTVIAKKPRSLFSITEQRLF
jgi:hypothetical protein